MTNYTNHKNNKPLSLEIRAQIEASFQAGVQKTQIAKNLGISHSVVRKYTKPLPFGVPEAVKDEALRLIKEGHTNSSIARSLGISRSYVLKLMPNPTKRAVPLSAEIKLELVRRAESGETVNAIARDLGIDAGNAMKIVKKHRAKLNGVEEPIPPSAKRYTAEQRLTMAQMHSQGVPLQEICGLFGATDTVIRKAYQKALDAGTVEPRFALSMEDDRQLLKIKRDFPQLEEWRVYAVQWYELVESNFAIVCTSINRFLRFLMQHRISPRPADFFLRQNSKLIPNFFEISCPKSDHGAAMNNALADFLDWVLIQPEFADDDEELGVTTLPIFRNPIARVRRSDHRPQRGSESNKQVMPYWMIHDLRRRIAQGRNLRDWTWVQGISGKITASGDKESRNWFQVDESQIDKADPDCVWRVRQRLDKGPVLEMWSPVRWVACLIKLQTTARMGQIRMIDSGEGDTFKVVDGTEVSNDSPIASGSRRKPRRQGAIRLSNEGTVVLYFNTNKTADIGRSWDKKGQECAWPHLPDYQDDPYYWIEKLRAWQEKYNPPTRLLPWKDVPSARRLKGKSDSVCTTYPDVVFLFRTPETKSATQFPVAAGAVDKAWQVLIAGYEKILCNEGKRNPDGSAIELVRDGRAETTIHGLRVSLITHLILDGEMAPELMMKIVGHARILMTLYYTKPGLQRIEDALADAAKKVDATKDAALIRDLKSSSAERMRKHVIFNAKEMIDVIPLNPKDRNPLGWLPMHDGLCLAGGNAGPVDGDPRFPGCHNGALELIPGQGHHGPAPGGVRNCCRCRWKCAGRAHIPGLQATFNNRQFHLYKSSSAAIDAERTRNDLLIEKARIEADGHPFLRTRELATAERLYEAAMQKMQELALDVSAVHRMIERIKALPDTDEGTQALAVQGDLLTVQCVVEETESELLVLSEVCAGVELYPDLYPGSAIFEYAQLLDMAFEREGKPFVLAKLSEKEKLLSANAIMRELERQANPGNRLLGRRKVVEIMDRKQSLQTTLGINLTDLTALANMGNETTSSKLKPLDLTKKALNVGS
ncbi:gamma-mobile-trio integrase GmtZ [Rugamonas rivuli]|uniref:Integrase n=1 Tax=Rugamonas rivuli TaxID=2743358 RepID=A0A843SAV1_9BURK|nr:VPA1269 family protein [Rugamonas rivuli]MQA19320.1 integrase [Rugamonas rivuli]